MTRDPPTTNLSPRPKRDSPAEASRSVSHSNQHDRGLGPPQLRRENGWVSIGPPQRVRRCFALEGKTTSLARFRWPFDPVDRSSIGASLHAVRVDKNMGAADHSR